MEPEIRLVIADDHPLLRQALKQMIEADPGLKVVAEAGNGREALEQVRRLRPDVAVLDVDMPHLDGFEVLRTLKAEGIAVNTIFLTVHNEAGFFREALALGAKGYILKDSAVTDIVSGIRAVADGQPYRSPALMTSTADQRPASRSGDSGLELLTPTERRVLALVAAYKTSAAIAEELGASPRTVQTHRANICDKLEIQGNHALMKFALEHASRL